MAFKCKIRVSNQALRQVVSPAFTFHFLLASTGKTESYSNYNQTYMQAVNNGTNTTTSANPVKSTTMPSEQSNVDLLSDLDITINHAPLVPEVRPLSSTQTQEDPAAKHDSGEASNEKKTENEEANTRSTVAEDKVENENLQIVWDTWYNDVQPKKDPLGDPAALQKFISEVEKYEKFVDSLLIKTLSGATNLDIKWKEVQEFEVRPSESLSPCKLILPATIIPKRALISGKGERKAIVYSSVSPFLGEQSDGMYSVRYHKGANISGRCCKLHQCFSCNGNHAVDTNIVHCYSNTAARQGGSVLDDDMGTGERDNRMLSI